MRLTCRLPSTRYPPTW